LIFVFTESVLGVVFPLQVKFAQLKLSQEKKEIFSFHSLRTYQNPSLRYSSRISFLGSAAAWIATVLTVLFRQKLSPKKSGTVQKAFIGFPSSE
jgi:hypothetical protein